MKRTLKYEIEKIKVSNEKWILNHIQEFLHSKNYKTEFAGDWLWFRDKFHIFQRRSDVFQANVFVYTSGPFLCVQIGSSRLPVIIFLSFLVISFLSFVLQSFISDIRLGIVVAIAMFGVLSSGLFALNRYLRTRRISNEIDSFIREVCGSSS